jgi:hypothetical protein
MCKNEFKTTLTKRFCASQNSLFYGYKPHGVYSFNGFFYSIGITKHLCKSITLSFLKTKFMQLHDALTIPKTFIRLDIYKKVGPFLFKRIYFSIKRILFHPFQRICINMLNEPFRIMKYIWFMKLDVVVFQSLAIF